LELQPTYKGEKFKCPHCQVASQQRWFDQGLASAAANQIVNHVYYDYRSEIKDYQQSAIEAFIRVLSNANNREMVNFVPSKFSIAICLACGEISIWINSELVFPRKTSILPPNNDMDEDRKDLYREASTIFIDSPKGSTAILRLALQKLLKQIGKSGKNINNDIKELVSEGLSPKIQQALDLLRVIGNNAVHPGQIDVDDNSAIALKLFHILNFTAEEMITKPKELDFLYNDVIPDETKEHIKQRDGKS